MDFSNSTLCGELNEEEICKMEEFSKQIKEEIDSLELEALMEKEELEDDFMLLNLIINHAKRDEISVSSDISEEEEVDDEEEINLQFDSDDSLDSTTKIYLKKVKSVIIPYLRKE